MTDVSAGVSGGQSPETANSSAPKGKISAIQKIGYGSGQIAESAKFVAFDTFLFFYYNQVLGLSGTLAGLAVAIALIFDAVTDPLVGSLSDGWPGKRFGRRHPFMVASILPLIISIYAIFQPPTGMEGTALFVWFTVFAVLARGSMTLFSVPYVSLGAEMSDNYNERTSIVAWRQMFGHLTGVIVLGVGFGIMFAATPDYPVGMLNPEGYSSYALMTVILVFIGILLAIFTTTKFRTGSPNKSLAQLHPGTALKKAFTELWQALRIKSFSALFVGLLVIFILAGIQKAFTNHVGIFFWGFDSDDLFIYAMSIVAGIMIGVPFAGILGPYFEKRTLFVGALLASILIGAIAIISRFVGIAPENGDPALIWFVSGWSALWAMMVGITMVIGDSMMADITDEYEVEHGDRQEGIFFGARSFSAKASAGVGTMLGGFGLDLVGFPENASEAGPISQEVLNWVALLSGPIWTPIAIGAAMIVMLYRIDRKRLGEIHAELAKRRSQ